MIDDDFRRRARAFVTKQPTQQLRMCSCTHTQTHSGIVNIFVFSLSHRFAAVDQHRLPRVSIILLHQFGAQHNARQQIYTHTHRAASLLLLLNSSCTYWCIWHTHTHIYIYNYLAIPYRLVGRSVPVGQGRSTCRRRRRRCVPALMRIVRRRS